MVYLSLYPSRMPLAASSGIAFHVASMNDVDRPCTTLKAPGLTEGAKIRTSNRNNK